MWRSPSPRRLPGNQMPRGGARPGAGRRRIHAAQETTAVAIAAPVGRHGGLREPRTRVLQPGEPKKVHKRIVKAIEDPAGPFDLKQVELLSFAGCPEELLADYFEVPATEFDEWKARSQRLYAALRRGNSNGKISIYKKMMEMGMKGSVPMLIHLSKSLLGNKEVVEQKHSGEIKLVLSKEDEG